MWNFLSQGPGANFCAVREAQSRSEENRHVLSLLHLVQDGVNHLKEKLSVEINERNEEEAALWRAMHTIQTQTAQQLDELRFWKAESTTETAESFHKLEARLNDLKGDHEKIPDDQESQCALRSPTNSGISLLQVEVQALWKFQEQARASHEDLKVELATLSRSLDMQLAQRDGSDAGRSDVFLSAEASLLKEELANRFASLQREFEADREARASEFEQISKDLQDYRTLLNESSGGRGSLPNPLKVMKEHFDGDSALLSDALKAELSRIKDLQEQVAEDHQKLREDLQKLATTFHAQMEHAEDLVHQGEQMAVDLSNTKMFLTADVHALKADVVRKFSTLQDEFDSHREVHASELSRLEKDFRGGSREAVVVEVKDVSEVSDDLREEIASLKNFQRQALRADAELKEELEILSARFQDTVSHAEDLVQHGQQLAIDVTNTKVFMSADIERLKTELSSNVVALQEEIDTLSESLDKSGNHLVQNACALLASKAQQEEVVEADLQRKLINPPMSVDADGALKAYLTRVYRRALEDMEIPKTFQQQATEAHQELKGEIESLSSQFHATVSKADLLVRGGEQLAIDVANTKLFLSADIEELRTDLNRKFHLLQNEVDKISDALSTGTAIEVPIRVEASEHGLTSEAYESLKEDFETLSAKFNGALRQAEGFASEGQQLAVDVSNIKLFLSADIDSLKADVTNKFLSLQNEIDATTATMTKLEEASQAGVRELRVRTLPENLGEGSHALHQEIEACLMDFCTASKGEFDQATTKVLAINGDTTAIHSESGVSSVSVLSDSDSPGVATAVKDAVQQSAAANQECEDLRESISVLSKALPKPLEINGLSKVALKEIEAQLTSLKKFQARATKVQEELQEYFQSMSGNYEASMQQAEELLQQSSQLTKDMTNLKVSLCADLEIVRKEFSNKLVALQNEVGSDREAVTKELEGIKAGAGSEDCLSSLKKDLNSLKIFLTERETLADDPDEEIIPLESQLEELAHMIEEVRIDAHNKVAELDTRLGSVIGQWETSGPAKGVDDLAAQVAELRRRVSFRRRSSVAGGLLVDGSPGSPPQPQVSCTGDGNAEAEFSRQRSKESQRTASERTASPRQESKEMEAQASHASHSVDSLKSFGVIHSEKSQNKPDGNGISADRELPPLESKPISDSERSQVITEDSAPLAMSPRASRSSKVRFSVDDFLPPSGESFEFHNVQSVDSSSFSADRRSTSESMRSFAIPPSTRTDASSSVSPGTPSMGRKKSRQRFQVSDFLDDGQN